jgi:hypothetical protein
LPTPLNARWRRPLEAFRSSCVSNVHALDEISVADESLVESGFGYKLVVFPVRAVLDHGGPALMLPILVIRNIQVGGQANTVPHRDLQVLDEPDAFRPDDACLVARERQIDPKSGATAP